MDIHLEITLVAKEACKKLFKALPESLQLLPTNPSFEGSHTLICFPLAKQYKKNPDEIARQIGDYLLAHTSFFQSYNVVKGFLNLVLTDETWINAFGDVLKQRDLGTKEANGKEVVIEISSPNTNKPLHLGHLRNNFLGASVSALYEALGYKVHKVQIINDRGIHICKSMIAWQKMAAGATPESTHIKGDKLVGNYYVAFNNIYRQQVSQLIDQGFSPKRAEKEAPIMQEAIRTLKKWEKKDPDTMALWSTMNKWVYDGFEATYKRMGVDFNRLYFESDTYLLGKREVLQGLEKGIFYKEKDGSVWVNLTDEGMDKKVLLRSDGTSMYITQDIGTAICRYRDFPHLESQVYTVGNEQEYHFNVLFRVLARLGYTWANRCYHLSYGMVDLPSGKMKSREGTVVDADDLMQKMVEKAEEQTCKLGKIEGLTRIAANRLFETLGIGAIKYYLLKVDPKKRIIFDPNESIQLQGNTGPFIQYTYARIRSMLRKAVAMQIRETSDTHNRISKLLPEERALIECLVAYPGRLQEALQHYNPSVIANYVYELAKIYNRFYQTVVILREKDPDRLQFRLSLSEKIADVIKRAMHVLQIDVPERM